MSTSYPTGLDSYTTLVDNVDTAVAAHINNPRDAIVALETKVGVTNSAVTTTVDYFMNNASGKFRTHVHDGGSDDGALLDWDNCWTDAVHTHASNAEGGTLDWDNCWADAAHDHTTAAEGGTVSLDWDTCWTDAVHSHTSDAEGGVLPAASKITGDIIQIVNTQTGSFATATTTIPYDNTIPQNTEGTEYMTLAITPTSATNKLKIDVVFNSGTTDTGVITTVALFQDSGANALACIGDWNYIGYPGLVAFTHYMTAETTNLTTFKVRAGNNLAVNLFFNGGRNNTSGMYGGICASSITITEIKV